MSAGPASAQPDALHRALATVRVTVCGEPRDIAAGTTVAELLGALGIAGKPCAVELNRTIVPRGAHGECRLAEGDAVEIVGFVGGG